MSHVWCRDVEPSDTTGLQQCQTPLPQGLPQGLVLFDAGLGDSGQVHGCKTQEKITTDFWITYGLHMNIYIYMDYIWTGSILDVHYDG
jgi:hypothetical protein